MDTIQNNKLIAEFLNKKYKDDYIVVGDWHKCTVNPSGDVWGKCKYHSDWNSLMEVVEKIESLTDINSNGCFMLLESIGFNAKFIFDDGTRILKDSKGETKFGAVYNACVEFIKWYNEQNK
jgi:hypothetical protein